MKKLIFALLVMLIPTLALAVGDVTVAWDPNPPAEAVTHYRVYYSTTSGTFSPSTFVEVAAPLTQTPINNLADGTWYFVATARRGTVESGYSNEISTVINTAPNVPPSAPGILRVVDIQYRR